MDPAGVSIISAKPLPTPEHAYHNQAFNDQALDKNGNLAGVMSTAGSVNADPLELAHSKRESVVGDFHLSDKQASKSRGQSFSEVPYRGMGKEDLLRFSSRPLWRNLRYICISIILTGWLALLITVVALVLTYPSCKPAQKLEWWETAVVYRVYVRSFFDSNRDGIGDIQGVLQKLDYIQSLGVNTISLSPVYTLAPGAPTDTHVVNHTDLDPVYGTLTDFQNLVNETHNRDMYLTMDFIPSHTSDQHPWFQASRSSIDPRQNVFRSYYVWAPGRGNGSLEEPNNWMSMSQCTPAWTLGDQNFFYLHKFMTSQPDLNLRSTKVKDALEEILLFWLDQGVDGFYIRDADFLFEDYDLRDEVDNPTSQCQSSKYPRYTKGLDEVFDMLARWRTFLDDYGNKTGKYRILFADVDAPYDHVMKYYGLFHRDGVDFPLNKFSLQLNATTDGDFIRDLVSRWTELLERNHWPDWMTGDDRSDRLADRLGEVSGVYLMMILLLPGTTFFYYGDEIGLKSLNLTDGQGPSLALPMRGPMQWNNMTSAGFCPENCPPPWLNFTQDKNLVNVQAQLNRPDSLLNLLKNLTSLRKDNPSFSYGDYVTAIQDREVFSFVREYDGEKGYLVVLNFSDQTVRRSFRGVHDTIPAGAKVELVTGRSAGHSRSGTASLYSLSLAPLEGIVVSWDYQPKEL